MRVICSSLEKVTRLQSLSFDNNNIGDNGGDRLALALAANKRVQLHTLTLTRNVLGR
jgi:Ran GTPase-activating protein (RanGAP) involved in mRNA processing and transport